MLTDEKVYIVKDKYFYIILRKAQTRLATAREQ